MAKRALRISARLRGCTTELKKGFGPGVIGFVDLVFDSEDERDPMLAKQILEAEHSLVETLIEVVLVDLDKENGVGPVPEPTPT